MRPILLSALLLLSLPALAESIDIRFGILNRESGGNLGVVRETTDIPLFHRDTGFRFGYTIKIEPERSFSTYTIHYLPARPETLSGRLSGQAATAAPQGVRTEEEVHGQEVTFPLWFDQGDPEGLYRADIYVDGRLARSVRYEVKRP